VLHRKPTTKSKSKAATIHWIDFSGDHGQAKAIRKEAHEMGATAVKAAWLFDCLIQQKFLELSGGYLV